MVFERSVFSALLYVVFCFSGTIHSGQRGRVVCWINAPTLPTMPLAQVRAFVGHVTEALTRMVPGSESDPLLRSTFPDERDGQVLTAKVWPPLPSFESMDDFARHYFPRAVYEEARTAHGAGDRNRSRLISWAAKQGNFQPQGTFFLLTSTDLSDLSHQSLQKHAIREIIGRAVGFPFLRPMS